MSDDILEQYKPKRRNGPPPLPSLVDGAEEEIRRTILRHNEQLASIAQLTTDRDHWRVRAEIAEGDNERLLRRQAAQEARISELTHALSMLEGQYHAGVQVWLQGYDTIRGLNLPQSKIVTPPELSLPSPGSQTDG